MDLLISCMLCILFTMALVKTFYVVAGGSKTSSGRLPPGPVALPIVGNLLQLGDKPHKSLAKLAKIHGPIMSLKLGKVTAVIFSSATMAKEVLQKHDIAFANRTVVVSLMQSGSMNMKTQDCLGCPFHPHGEFIEKYATRTYFPARDLMPVKKSGKRKYKNCLFLWKKVAALVNQLISAKLLSVPSLICYPTLFFRWTWLIQIQILRGCSRGL
ncbi:geraniol 8-hydroxylase-like [Tripterygium wilfordii]|uniref:Geraniol 8-hydroxylase-like n=1 Tax=Tripterygium wilfordii TaxID=458696 RepID=A0A7J7C712_TRIWF|nr:geraniol 8-hydroxylase-like [Tripterygium wilfordii]